MGDKTYADKGAALAQCYHEPDWVGDNLLPRYFPKGHRFRIAEWYGCDRTPDGRIRPDVGVKMTAEQVADGINEREAEHPILKGREVHPGAADSAIFASDEGPTIASKTPETDAPTLPRAANRSLI